MLIREIVMKQIRLLFSITLTLLTFFSMSAVTASAEDDRPPLYEIFKDHTSYTMVASRKGYFAYAPENSLPAIKAAENSGADIIEIDIRTTADGVLILMEDETVIRTCYDYGENTVVSEMPYNKIKTLKLLSGQGGVNAEKTAEAVPTLEEVFKDRKLYYLSSSSTETKQKALFMLDFDWSIRDKISNLVIENDMENEVIFYIDDAKPDEIEAWKETLPFEPMIMTYFKGNVIFAATANVKNDAETADCIHLATKNPYGVIFGETVQNTAYETGIRTMATPCCPEICGTQMQDTEIWWDYLISAGFNVIMTDNVTALRTYVDDSHNKKALELDRAINIYIDQWQLPDFNQDKFLDYKLAYTNAAKNAENLMSRDLSRSYSDITTAVYELRKAVEDINLNYDSFEDGTAGTTINPLTIFLSALAIAVVTVAEIYVYKKKKK